jgi:hypothetical protein
MNYLFLFIGILIFNIGRYYNARQKKKSVWSWKKFLTDNGIPSLISLLFGISLILGKSVSIENVSVTISIITINVNIYLLIGVFSDVVAKKLWDLRKVKK